MLVLVHVILALGSMAYTTYLLIHPVRSHFRLAYSLVALTLASGTYLVWQLHTPLLPACFSGLLYLGIVSMTLVAAHYRLAKIERHID